MLIGGKQNRVEETMLSNFSCMLRIESRGRAPTILWPGWKAILSGWCCPSPHIMSRAMGSIISTEKDLEVLLIDLPLFIILGLDYLLDSIRNMPPQ